MKYTFKMMWILALGAGLFTMSSCSEDEGDDPTPNENTEKVCYPTKIVSTDSDGDEVLEYTYNSENLVTESKNTYDGEVDIVTYAYDNGQLVTATEGNQVSTFIYDGAQMPSRVNIQEDGEDLEYLIIESNSDNQITKVEYYYYDGGQAILDFRDIFTYTNGTLSSYISETYDSETETFETDLALQDFVFDDKKSPYGGQVAFAYESDFTPLSITGNNLVSANLVADDGMGGEIKIPYNATYTYNDNDYPTASTLTLFNQTTTINITYDCK